MRRYSLGFLSSVFALTMAAAAQSVSEVPYDLPAHAIMAVVLGNELHTGTARVGMIVVMNLAKPIHRPGKRDVPAGAALVGRVSEVERKSKTSTKTRLSVCMDYLQWNSQSMPIHAMVVGFDWTVVESTGKGIVPSSRADPALESDMSVLVNRPGSNRLPGVAIVADEKLGTVLVSKAKEIFIPAGTKLYLREMDE